MRVPFFKWTILVGKYAKSVIMIGVSAILIMTGCYIFTVQGSGAKAISVIEGAHSSTVADTGGEAAEAVAMAEGEANGDVGGSSGGVREAAQLGSEAGGVGNTAAFGGKGPSGGGMGEEGKELAPSNIVHIYVTGAVNKPGVYALEKSSMVVEAVEMAGGLTDEADEENINMVFKLENNAMLNIKRKVGATETSGVPREGGSGGGGGEVPGDGNSGGGGSEASGEGSLYGSGIRISDGYDGKLIEIEDAEYKTGGDNANANANASAKVNGSASAVLININTSTKEELSLLPGIGAATANNIIGYREKNGGFSKIEDIMKVTGIKQAKFEAIKEYITV